MPGLSLMATLGLDGSGFHTGLKKADGAAHGVLEGLKGFVVGAVGVATVETAIHKTVETAEKLVQTSKRLAIAPEMLQVLGKAAKEGGTNLEELAGQLEKIDVARQRYLSGGEEGAKAGRGFQALGVNDAQLRSMSAAQLFTGPMSDKAKSVNPEQLGVAFRELGIKGFGPLIAVLKTDFAELGAEMKNMGAIMDTDTAVRLEQFSDTLEVVTMMIAAKLGPILLDFAMVLIKVFAGLQEAYAYIKGLLTSNTKPMAESMQWQSRNIMAAMAGKKTEPPPKPETEAEVAYSKNAASTAADKVASGWHKWFQEMEDRMSKLANELKNPTRPDFTVPTLAANVPKKAMLTPSDSLSRVGNFYGGMGIVNSIQDRMLQAQERTARNTEIIALNSHSRDGSWGGTHYPHS